MPSSNEIATGSVGSTSKCCWPFGGVVLPHSAVISMSAPAAGIVPVWSKISNALKRLGFRSRNFLAQLLSETSRACTIRVRQSTSGRLWNDLGSHACLHHRNRRPGTFTEERISGRREPDPESPNQRQVAVIRCRKATLAEIAHRLGRKALEELAAGAGPDTLLAWYRKLLAYKFDGSKFRKFWGRPRICEETQR